MAFRRSSMMYEVSAKTRASFESHARSSGSDVPGSVPASPMVHPLDFNSASLPFVRLFSPTGDEGDESGLSDGEDSNDEDAEDDQHPGTRETRRRSSPTSPKLKAIADPMLIRSMSTPFANKYLSDLGRRIMLIAKAYKQQIIGSYDNWHDFKPSPAVRAKRLMYNPQARTWDVEPVLVQLGDKPFDRGALRECFKMKEIKGQELKRLFVGEKECCRGVVDSHFRMGRTCWVAKRYLKAKDYCLHKQDVAMQMVSKWYAEQFNVARSKKICKASIPVKWKHATHPVDFLMSHLIEFEEGAVAKNAQTFSVEAFVFGKFDKYNTNSGLVSSCHRTPQAFSHFTYEQSGRRLICVDVQGVDNLYTDPAVHAPADFLWCEANLGFRGLALFFWSHRCNEACRCLGLPCFPTYAETISKKRGAVDVKELAEAAWKKTDTELIAAQKNVKESRVKLEPLLSFPDVEQWDDLPHIPHPKKREAVMPKDLMNPCIHMELCSMYASGRLSDSPAGEARVSPEGAIFHLQQAARSGLQCALLGLARLCSDLPHEDFLPQVVGCSVPLCLQLLYKAAKLGSEHAAGSLALLLEQGTYEEPDPVRAAEMYECYATAALGSDSSGAEEELAHVDENVDLEEIASMAGMMRPTAWDNSFGWENHGLAPHTALGAAARLVEQQGSTRELRQKASELYRWASEAAIEAMSAKLSMKYGEKADELDALLEEEEEEEKEADGDESKDGFSSSDEEEQAKAPRENVSVSSETVARLQVLGKSLDMDDVGDIMEFLLNSYRQGQETGRRRSYNNALNPESSQTLLPRSILKKTTFAAVPMEVIGRSSASDSDGASDFGDSKTGSTTTDDSDTKVSLQMSARDSLEVSPPHPPTPHPHTTVPRSKRGSSFMNQEDAENLCSLLQATAKEPSPEKHDYSGSGRTVRVQVFDTAGQPMQGAVVGVVTADGSPLPGLEMCTDSRGWASLTPPTNQTLRLVVQREGYNSHIQALASRSEKDSAEAPRPSLPLSRQ